MLAICAARNMGVAQEFVPATDRACFLAEDTASFAYTFSSDDGNVDPAEWRVEWSITSDNRTVSSGTGRAVDVAAADAQLFVFQVPTPPLRPGVVLAAEMHTAWTDDETTYHHHRPIYLFSRDPFPARESLFERAAIKLFDPVGDTEKLFDESEIPYSSLSTLSAIDGVKNGIVIVGEGVSLADERNLAETLVATAARGLDVVCLAPSEGELPLVFGKVKPSRVSLERANFVRRYDKRFDNLPVASPLALEPVRDIVVVRAGAERGWAALEIIFPQSKPDAKPGSLLLCGVGIVSEWESSPVPRYLFAHLLTQLADATSNPED